MKTKFDVNHRRGVYTLEVSAPTGNTGIRYENGRVVVTVVGLTEQELDTLRDFAGVAVQDYHNLISGAEHCAYGREGESEQ